MPLKDIIIPKSAKVSKEPLWKGPEKDGITFSLLSRYLSCKERFRIMVVEGLKAKEGFNHRLEYGNMWHLCEEVYLGGGKGWELVLWTWCQGLKNNHPFQKHEVEKWFEVCRLQFKIYIDWWKHQPKFKPILQEYAFKIPILLPSGRTVIQRGKWDTADHENSKEHGLRLWCGEHKTKGMIDQKQLTRQLSFDLQTMIYVTAMQEARNLLKYQRDPLIVPRFQLFQSLNPYFPQEVVRGGLAGVRYNVIRRPLSGGKGMIRQKKPTKKNPKGETKDEYYSRVAKYITDDPKSYFMRWDVGVSTLDIERFKRQCLYPVLENLCDDWEWWEFTKKEKVDVYDYTYRTEFFNHYQRHYRHPFGVYNPTDEGRVSDLDSYLDTGSEIGLERVTNLFPELVPG